MMEEQKTKGVWRNNKDMYELGAFRRRSAEAARRCLVARHSLAQPVKQSHYIQAVPADWLSLATESTSRFTQGYDWPTIYVHGKRHPVTT